jgi:uncharacterized RmlC-like cupin family protein
MDIKRSGADPSGRGPAETFTGAVRVDPLHDAPNPARVSVAVVTFEPGARTAWHTHHLGQTLIVTAGLGRAQRWGGPIDYFGEARHLGGSHRIYKTPWIGDPRVNIQDDQGMAKVYQVRQVLKAIDRLEKERNA